MTQYELEKKINEAVLFVEKDEVERPFLPEFEIKEPIGQYCDHSVLRAYTKKEIIREFCDEAIKYHAASVAVCPCNIPFVAECLKGSGVKPDAAIGFPLGNTTISVKAFEAAEAVRSGAEEIDLILNNGKLRDGDYLYIYDEIVAVREAIGKNIPLKVILENCYLNKKQKIAGCVVCELAGADWIKTSTGFGTGGATLDDVILMRRTVNDRVKIKAATGVNTRKEAEMFIKNGAQRLGISRLIAICTGVDDADCASKHNKVPDAD